jgi:hypothetical protein
MLPPTSKPCFEVERLIQCGRSNVMEHRERHVTHVARSTLHHLHVDVQRFGKLSWQQGVALLETVDEHLERGDHSRPLIRDDFALRR